MKLKGLKPRLQNIFFHLHTVSGIFISFALFIIFYAGAFAIFKDEIFIWEDHEARIHQHEETNIDKTLSKYLETHPNFDSNVNFSLMLYEHNPYFIGISGLEKAKKGSKTPPKRVRELIKKKDGTAHKIKTTVGQTLFHLHYFAQIPKIGMYLSSLVAFFFFMATITGVIIHWKNIFKKFYAIITVGNWQKIWTNLHTALGVLTIPFQLIYGITGAFFGLRILFFIPTIAVLFGGDQLAAFSTISPEYYIKPDTTATTTKEHFKLNPYFKKIKTAHPKSTIKSITIARYGYEDAFASFYVDNGRGSITGSGSITYNLKTGRKRMENLPENGNYNKAIIDGLRGLHFANFGNLSLRGLFFLLAFLCCFIILSGILIWEKARKTSAYTDKQKRFHYRTTNIYICVCLGLVTAVPLLFVVNKCIALSTDDRISKVNNVFFIGWLALIISGLFYKSHKNRNEHYLIIAGLLALVCPIANGLVSGDWIWSTATKMPYVFGVDTFWLSFSLISLLTVAFSVRKEKRFYHK